MNSSATIRNIFVKNKIQDLLNDKIYLSALISEKTACSSKKIGLEPINVSPVKKKLLLEFKAEILYKPQ